jgi:hypothetical protein
VISMHVYVSGVDALCGTLSIYEFGGQRRLSPPRGAGWEPVNAFAAGYLQSQVESQPASWRISQRER